LMHDSAADPLAEFLRSNAAGTLALAEAAAEAGVRRFVYLSSIKVLGERTLAGQRFRVNDPPQPADPYGISKHEAEVGLRRLAGRSRMQIVVIRPPLIYGPGVRANFLRMMRWVHRGVPLPFGAIDNVRSLAALDNVVDLVRRCVEHPAAANQTFHVSDDEDVSTSDLLRRIALAFGKPARLLPVPPRLLLAVASLVGLQGEIRRLEESLVVDIARTRETLSWSPPVTLDEGLRRTVAGFLADSATPPAFPAAPP